MPLIGSLGAAASRGFGQFLQKITAVLNTDAFFKYVTLLLTGNPPVSTFVTDASTNNLQVTINGDTKPSGFSPNEGGYYSNYFDGTNNLNVPNNSAFAYGTGDFTIEAWVYHTNSGSYAGYSYGGSSGLVLRRTNSNTLEISQDGVASIAISSGTIASNQWVHVAGTRSGSTVRLFINGVLNATATYSGNFSPTTGGTIGSIINVAGYYMTGYISNLRIVKGTALYTAPFTPPTTPLTAVSGTSLLTCQSNRFIDNSTNAFAITANGNTTVNSFQPFTPNPSFATYGSTYFDGSGDYLSVASAFSFSGNFTVECWVYVTGSVSGYGNIWGNGNISGTIQVYIDNATKTVRANLAFGSDLIAGSAVSLNTWNHIALTRSGSTLTLWLNGVSQGTSTTSVVTSWSANQFWIGNLMTGYISNFRSVNGTALYTSAFTPPTTQLTAVTNTSLLTCQTNQPVNNNVFLDSSSNSFAITRAGNTTQGSLNPYGGNWSVQTDNGSNLSAPANTALRLTGDFTIEAWIYPTTVNNNMIVGSDAGSTSDFFGITTNRIQIGINSGTYPTWTTSFVANTWYHVALTRSSNFLRAFVNGTQLTLASGSATNSGTMFQANALLIGKYGYTTSPAPFYGNISNLRLVKGTALYTASFTPPTAPLTAVTNTVLLTCQSNRYVDNSLNNFSVTATGSPKAQRFSPFSPILSTPTSYSNYFDGSGDYLNCSASSAQFGAGDFTIECWVYPTSLAVIQVIVDFRTTSTAIFGQIYLATNGTVHFYLPTDIATTNTVTLNTWNHIAISRSAGTLQMFINGTSGYSAANSGTYNAVGTYIGISISNTNGFTGYISNMRFITGTGIYTSNFTPSTTPLTAVSGTSLLTCQSPTFIDNSTNNFAITATGNVVPRTQNPFGVTNNTDAPYTPATYGGSMYFDGTTDYLTLATNPQLGMGSGDFTVEFWTYQTSLVSYRQILDVVDANSVGRLILWVDSAGTIYNLGQNGNSRNTSAAGAIVANTWVHVVLTRSSGTTKFYINGVQSGTNYTDSTNYTCTSGSVYIGINSDGGTYPYIGYLANFRMVKGTSLYKANFAPPVAPLQAVTNTSLLLLGSNGAVYDSAMFNDAETLGDSKTSTAQSKFNGSSVLFDGTGDYLKILPSNRYQFQANYTIEFWIYFNSVTGTQDIIGNYVSNVATDWIVIMSATGIQYYPSGSSSYVYSGASSVTTNTWYHVAAVRSGSTCSLYLNGVSVGTPLTFSATLGDTTKPLYIGSRGGSTNYFNGYMDDLRITNGYARYTQNFTVPTQPFPVQ